MRRDANRSGLLGIVVTKMTLITWSAVWVAAFDIFRMTCAPWMPAMSVDRLSESAEMLFSGRASNAHILGGLWNTLKNGGAKSARHNSTNKKKMVMD